MVFWNSFNSSAILCGKFLYLILHMLLMHYFWRNLAFNVKISMCLQTHEDSFLMLSIAANTLFHNNALSDFTGKTVGAFGECSEGIYKGREHRYNEPFSSPISNKVSRNLLTSNMNTSHKSFIWSKCGQEKCIPILFDTNMVLLNLFTNSQAHGFSNPFKSSMVFRIIYSLLILKVTN